MKKLYILKAQNGWIDFDTVNPKDLQVEIQAHGKNNLSIVYNRNIHILVDDIYIGRESSFSGYTTTKSDRVIKNINQFNKRFKTSFNSDNVSLINSLEDIK